MRNINLFRAVVQETKKSSTRHGCFTQCVIHLHHSLAQVLFLIAGLRSKIEWGSNGCSFPVINVSLRVPALKTREKRKNPMAELVFTPYITLKNGRVLWAKEVGKKVFCFPAKSRKGEDGKQKEID